MEKAKKFREQRDKQKRKQDIQGLTRWEEFRMRREKIMFEYVLKKKAIRSATHFLRYFLMRNVLTTMRMKVARTVLIRCKKYRLAWGIFKIVQNFKRFMRKTHGAKTPDQINHTKIMHSLHFQGHLISKIVAPLPLMHDAFVEPVRAMVWRSEFSQIVEEFGDGVRYI